MENPEATVRPERGGATGALVFISHASEDRKVADAICSVLENRGVSCWIASRDVPPGENFGEAIARGMHGAKVMVLVFSDEANNSNEIKKEVVLAGRIGVPVIPVRVEDIEPSGAFEYELLTRQWIDLFVNWDQAMERLVHHIEQVSGHAAARREPARLPETPPPGPAVPAGEAVEIASAGVREVQQLRRLPAAAIERKIDGSSRPGEASEPKLHEAARRLAEELDHERLVAPGPAAERAKPERPGRRRHQKLLAGAAVAIIAGAILIFHFAREWLSPTSMLPPNYINIDQTVTTAERQRKAAEAAQQAEAQRKAAEEAAQQVEAQRKAAEAAQQAEAQRKAAEAAQQSEAQRKAAEAAQQAEAAILAAKVLFGISGQSPNRKWGVGNCGNPTKLYSVEIRDGTVRWLSSNGDVDIETIDSSGGNTLQTTTVRSSHTNGAPEQVGTPWTYTRVGGGIQVTRGGKVITFNLVLCD